MKRSSLAAIAATVGLAAPVVHADMTETTYADADGRVQVTKRYIDERTGNETIMVQLLSTQPLTFELAQKDGSTSVFKPYIRSVADYERWLNAQAVDFDGDGDTDIVVTNQSPQFVLLSEEGELVAQELAVAEEVASK